MVGDDGGTPTALPGDVQSGGVQSGGVQMTLTTGQLLAQRYRLERRIAVGGMGEVWQAGDTRLGRQVAVKVLKPELSGDPEFRDRFHTEARLTASLNHPGIAAVHDYGETQSAISGAGISDAFLVMELVSGDSLATILLRDPRLSVDWALDILGQAADALQAAHERGLVHRDIKPANILITPAGRVKLTDFGIARAVDAAPVTRQGMVMGTAHYIAPEQAAGQQAGPASDIYSLGVVGYECLAGKRPFPADSAIAIALMHIHEPPPPLPSDVPPEVRALIEATLVKDPSRRYGTGGEFAMAVAAVQAGRRPPRPAGMTGTTALQQPGSFPPPQTALLPSGTMTGPHPRPHPGRYPPQRNSRRGTTGVAVALLAVLTLVLAGYVLRDVVQSSNAAPAPSSTVPSQPPPAPTQTQEPEPATPDPADEDETQEPIPQLVPGRVVILWLDYVGKSGSAAAAIAVDRELEPLVVDRDGDEIDPDNLSTCQVTEVEPGVGVVPVGSTLTLTCEERS